MYTSHYRYSKYWRSHATIQIFRDFVTSAFRRQPLRSKRLSLCDMWWLWWQLLFIRHANMLCRTLLRDLTSSMCKFPNLFPKSVWFSCLCIGWLNVFLIMKKNDTLHIPCAVISTWGRWQLCSIVWLWYAGHGQALQKPPYETCTETLWLCRWRLGKTYIFCIQ